jgi:hypothetical protein
MLQNSIPSSTRKDESWTLIYKKKRGDDFKIFLAICITVLYFVNLKFICLVARLLGDFIKTGQGIKTRFAKQVVKRYIKHVGNTL